MRTPEKYFSAISPTAISGLLVRPVTDVNLPLRLSSFKEVALLLLILSSLLCVTCYFVSPNTCYILEKRRFFLKITKINRWL